ncbi:MAG: tetratricopeptide repeat protein [Bacteroidales bacterium]|nr:tetratricopeptide repeat protein [Bacteroidales bacterium]
MKIKTTIRIGFVAVVLGICSISSVEAQQIDAAGQKKKPDQDQRMKAMGVDSMPATIFPAKKELTPTEKEAQRLYLEGSKKGKSGDYTGAIEDLTQSLALVENGSTYMRRGFAYLLEGKFTLALQDFNEALRLIPSNKEAIFGRGIARFEMRDYSEAEVDLAHYLSEVQTNAVAYNYMAALCFMRQDYQCALKNYSDVIRCDSLYPDCWLNRAMIRNYLRDFAGALEDCNVAMKYAPNDKRILNNRATAKMFLKDYASALEDFNKAIEQDPKFAEAYINRGWVHYYLKDTEGACADWQKSLSFGIQASGDLIVKYCK